MTLNSFKDYRDYTWYYLIFPDILSSCPPLRLNYARHSNSIHTVPTCSASPQLNRHRLEVSWAGGDRPCRQWYHRLKVFWVQDLSNILALTEGSRRPIEVKIFRVPCRTTEINVHLIDINSLTSHSRASRPCAVFLHSRVWGSGAEYDSWVLIFRPGTGSSDPNWIL